MRTYDLANMLGAFDESFNVLIRLLEKNEPELALIRAHKMQDALRKCMGFLGRDKDEEARLIDKL